MQTHANLASGAADAVRVLASRRSAFAAAPPVSIVGEHDRIGTLVFARFLDVAQGLTEIRQDGVESDVTYAETMSAINQLGWTVVAHVVSHGEHTTLLTIPTAHGGDATALVYTEEAWGEWRFQVVAETAVVADSAVAAIAALLPARTNDADSDFVNVNFWMYDPMMGGMSISRRIDRLAWGGDGGIAGNYPASVRSGVRSEKGQIVTLDELSSLEGPMSGGRLAVFHGPPGTGKTRFLQSLASSWAPWCDVHYVVDPDEMFNAAPYLYRVVLGDSRTDRWRLVVMEDGDEFIASDGKKRSGAAVSRLLNVADGLIGQGLKVQFLISTNVEELAFNSAIVRSGRCGAQIEFPHFGLDEADEWLLAHGIETDLPEDSTFPLSDLYAHLS